MANTENTDTKPLNLICKLAAIRQELDHIEKKGTNAHFGYKFMRAEDVAGDIGDRFAAVNVVIGCDSGRCEVHKMDKGFMVLVECTYRFVDGDSGESLTVWSCGTGYDSGDKGSFKARTGALKYALTQALCMRVGDDAEADDDDDDEKPPKKQPNAGERVEPDYPIASPGQLRLLDISAERKHGKNFSVWLDGRLEELHTSRAALSLPDFQMLVNECIIGRTDEPPPPEDDPFA